MTVFIEIDEVYQIHERMIKIGGGKYGTRDFTLLHSAIERPKVTFGGKSLYPTIWLKAASLMHSLIKNHAFNDGNKRTGFFSTLRFLELNGYTFDCPNKDIVDFSLFVDTKNFSLKYIASWLKQYSIKL